MTAEITITNISETAIGATIPIREVPAGHDIMITISSVENVVIIAGHTYIDRTMIDKCRATSYEAAAGYLNREIKRQYPFDQMHFEIRNDQPYIYIHRNGIIAEYTIEFELPIS